MARSNVLLILVVREAGLRTTLAGRLSMTEADLVTARDVHDPSLARHLSRSGVLILCEETVKSRPKEWLDAIVAEPGLRQVVVLGTPSATAAPHERLAYVEPSVAPAAIAEMIPRWQAGNG